MHIDFFPVIPEIFLLAAACLILLFDVYSLCNQKMVTFLLTQVTLLVTAFLTYWVFSKVGAQKTFFDSFTLDSLAVVLKIAICLITAVVFIYSRDYLQTRGINRGEFYVLGLFGVIGMMIMVSAYSLLVIYLGLELLALSLYALVAYHRDSPSASEAAMKYFVLGAIASGMLLYGMSMIYGSCGSLDIQVIHDVIAKGNFNNTVLVFGIVFVVVGLAFKFGAVPFHMWVPDVYHGAPTAVTLYISTAPKIAAFAMLMRLLVEGLGDMHQQWQGMIIILAVLSMGIGNVVAIAQANIKRMLAYSTIAHVGFLLLGILTGSADGYAASMFYVLVYALMSLGGFGMIILLSRSGFEADKLEDFKGLNERSPWYAAMMGMLMLSMAGIPPMIGFYAKLSVLQAVVESDMVWLAITAVVFSVIGAFYYLRIIKLMYFEKADDNTPLNVDTGLRVAISANGLLMLGLGVFPGGLMALCATALNVT